MKTCGGARSYPSSGWWRWGDGASATMRRLAFGCPLESAKTLVQISAGNEQSADAQLLEQSVRKLPRAIQVRQRIDDALKAASSSWAASLVVNPAERTANASCAAR